MSDRDNERAGLALTRNALRRGKPKRAEFLCLPRRPITVVLDGVRQPYNIGAIFRLCDAFLVERLVIAGAPVDLRKRKLVQAARGTQRWVPWAWVESAAPHVDTARRAGARVVVVEQTAMGLAPDALTPVFPLWLILGAEEEGVSRAVLKLANAMVTVPMLGMTNSINVATAAAIVLHRLSASF
jgi:tRNA G18 (ribose-2'-O)-methylase SpoU